MQNDGYDHQPREPDHGQQDQNQEHARNRPVETLRDGAIKATIWRNEGESGPYFSTTLSRAYQDSQGNWHDSHSFSGADLLKASELSR